MRIQNLFKKKKIRKDIINKHTDNIITYSKKAVKWLLIIGCINGTMPFILSFFNRDPVVDLGRAWVIEIVAVILGYLLKSFNENRQKAKQELEDQQQDFEEFKYKNENDLLDLDDPGECDA